MADNYIERQYEQYEARKAAWEKKRKQGKKKTISVKPQPKDLTDNTIKLPRKAFITGGADGIGRNIVKAFCNSQYQVAFCDKNEDLGIQTAKETGAIFYHADVSNKESLENCMHELFEKWGDMDIIINNAGISEFSPITETSVEDFDKMLEQPREMGEMTLKDFVPMSLRCQMRSNRKSGKCKEKQNIAGERFANHYPRRCKI